MASCHSSRMGPSQLLCRQRMVVIATVLNVFQRFFRQLQAHMNLYYFPHFCARGSLLYSSGCAVWLAIGRCAAVPASCAV